MGTGQQVSAAGQHSQRPGTRTANSGPFAIHPVVALAWLVLLPAAAWGLTGCGYVLAKVTALPDTPTATAPVRLSTPEPRFTPTIVPATPLPTATATATPTPIVYIVQKGDNLLAIAYHYDVNVQTLIEVNQIADPRALRIGQHLIIPPDDAALSAIQPTVTPTPMPLRIVNVLFHRTPAGSLWCLGEVENDRDEYLHLVKLQLSLYNADGTLIDRGTASTAADVIPGHGKAPFALLLPQPPASGYASYELVVSSAEPIRYWGRRHRALTVEQIAVEIQGNVLIVRGLVHNPTNADAQQTQVVLTAYGLEGQVVAVRQVEIGDLPAGARQEFNSSLIPAQPAARAEAIARGLKPAP